jgi:response regulator RpfG family c-di-GMP phosphodiesterase
MDCTILAVDDEPANLRMIERLLRKEYRVLTATSGEDALEVLKHEDVSLIITDQRMPGLSGVELLRESLRTNPDAMRIILTGYTDTDALIDAINTTRVYKFVSKPWDPVHLKRTIDEAVRQHRLATERKKLLEGLVALVNGSPTIFACEPENGRAFLDASVLEETVG